MEKRKTPVRGGLFFNNNSYSVCADTKADVTLIDMQTATIRAYPKIKAWFQTHSVWIVLTLTLTYALIFIVFAIWKYINFHYDALDLAIYNQVFWNTARGKLFGLTIHPHSYLGDHIELTLLLFAPFYTIFQHPITLLIIQTLWIASAAIPLFWIAQKILNKLWALLFTAAYLANAFIHNINTFEFHMLPLALPLLFILYWAYEKKNFRIYLLAIILLIFTREDIALVTFFFGFLPLLEKKQKRWWLMPMILSALWFPIALKITTLASGYEQYKFAYYYGWLGTTPQAIIQTFFTEPTKVLSYVFQVGNTFFLITILLAFALLPLFKMKYLIPTIPILAQFLLLGKGSGSIILETHYLTLIIPWFFISIIHVVKEWQMQPKPSQMWPIKRWVLQKLRSEPSIAIPIIITIFIYTFFTMSPLPSAAQTFVREIRNPNPKKAIQDDLLKNIRPTDVVVSSYNTLTHLSSRNTVYSLHYLWTGKKQLSDEPYWINTPVDTLYYDSENFLEYYFHWKKNAGFENFFDQGDNRMRAFLSEQKLVPSTVIDDIIVFRRAENAQADEISVKNNKRSVEPQNIYTLYQNIPKMKKTVDRKLSDEITLLGWNRLNQAHRLPYKTISRSLIWRVEKTPENTPFLRLQVRNPKKQILYQKFYALGYGVLPPTEWKQGDIIATNYWFVIPENFIQSGNIVTINLENFESGTFTLDGLRSANITEMKTKPTGPAVPIARF